MNPNLLLSEASFLLSHDAATGYITRDVSKSGLTRRYTQTVRGTFYDQLDSGARALDLRPLLLLNGTVVYQHGIIRIDQTSFERSLDDVLRWCRENPHELVILLSSHSQYETSTVSFARTVNDDQISTYYVNEYDEGAANDMDDDSDGGSSTTLFDAMTSILQRKGIASYECTDVYEWTVADAMEAGALANNAGYLLTLMSQSGSSCSKENWSPSQLVTCYPTSSKLSCKNSNEPWEALQDYMVQSANNAASDTNLGPPSDLYNTPLFQVQGLWQVDTHAVIAGLSQMSSILVDNRRSRINEKIMRMVYDESFTAISLLTVDNIVLHGNALTSVLRNQCGQLADDTLPCGRDLPPPRLRYAHLEPSDWLMLGIMLYFAWFIYSVVYLQRPKMLYTALSRMRRDCGNDNSRCEDLLAKEGPDDVRVN